MIRAEMSKTDGRKSLKGGLIGIKDDLRNQIKVDDSDTKLERLKPSKSVKKLERIERRLKLDDIKDINSVLR